MTMEDMVNMDINVDAMRDKLGEVSTQINVAANELADTAMQNFPRVTELESQKNGTPIPSPGLCAVVNRSLT